MRAVEFDGAPVHRRDRIARADAQAQRFGVRERGRREAARSGDAHIVCFECEFAADADRHRAADRHVAAERVAGARGDGVAPARRVDGDADEEHPRAERGEHDQRGSAGAKDELHRRRMAHRAAAAGEKRDAPRCRAMRGDASCGGRGW